LSTVDVVLSVSSVRSRGKHGGVIMAGRTDTGEPYTVSCNFKLIPDSTFPEKSQRWRITGHASKKSITVNGIKLLEDYVVAETAEFLRPSGKHIVDWISKSPDIQGVGPAKARKLYNDFGPKLIEIIENRDVHTLSKTVSQEVAERIIQAFEKTCIGETLLWLESSGIPRRTGQLVIGFLDREATAKIESNPYRLVSFGADWTSVDNLATSRFNVAQDDPRRLDAAIEEVLYKGFSEGHTCLPKSVLESRLKRLLGNAKLSRQALELESESYRIVDGNLYQPIGAHIIEHSVAEKIQALLTNSSHDHLSVFKKVFSENAVLDTLKDYERSNGIALSDAQRDAVLCAITQNFSLIFGGAGTGKTTVLKAIYAVFDALLPGLTIYQVALAGRAAQRMTEATERPSMTIARFIQSFDETQLGNGTLLVIDEGSMIDILLAHRLLRQIPSGTRVILVGDPSQLPPIGPGLVLHTLHGLSAIPQTELKVVKRQTESTGIPLVANAVRHHEIPVFRGFKGMGVGVHFVECGEAKIDEVTLSLYETLGGTGKDNNIKILCATKSGAGGTINTNARFHNHFSCRTEPVRVYDQRYGIIEAKTYEGLTIYAGDLVLATKNDYSTGLRNGSLGRIKTTFKSVETPDTECCIAEFDGEEIALTSSQVETLVHAYGITIHKSQGSQFERVIIPVRRSRLLDQTLIYTAITRGVEQVVLVGDREAADAAIRNPPSSSRRKTTLREILNDALDTGSQ